MSTPLNGSILKSFEILRLITPERPELTAAMIEAELDINFATAHRLLASLEEAGALFSVRRGAYRLSLATAEMGRLAEATNPFMPRLQPLIDDLRTELNESVMVCRLSQSGPICVCVALSTRPITVSIRVGTTLSMLNSAQGRLWLAAMDATERNTAIDRALAANPGASQPPEQEFIAIRKQGYAVNMGDVEADIAAVAAPIRDARGKPFLTVSVFGPVVRFGPDFLTEAKARMVEAARRIENDLRAG